MDSLSERMSPKFLVPNTFLRVVAANSLDRLVEKNCLLELQVNFGWLVPGRPAIVVHVGHGTDGILHLIKKHYTPC